MVKKTYIVPAMQVDETEIEGVLAMSIQLSNESGNEEYVKEQDGGERNGNWNIDW
jgi:hypothetical protein